MNINEKINLFQTVKKIASDPNVTKEQIEELVDSFMYLIGESAPLPDNYVETVSGALVDGTDPKNPVIITPTAESIGALTEDDLSPVATSGNYEDLENKPSYSFAGSDFELEKTGFESLIKIKQGYFAQQSTQISFDRPRIFGNIDNPLSGELTFDKINATLGTEVIVFHTGGLVLSEEYKASSFSEVYVDSDINMMVFKYISDDFIIYTNQFFTGPPENLLLWSNKFNEYGAWGSNGTDTRTQQADDSWNVVYSVEGGMNTLMSVTASTEYTFSIELKSVPDDLVITLYAMPDFVPLLVSDPIGIGGAASTFSRYARTITIPSEKTELYMFLESSSGGVAEIQKAQLNKGSTVKPYIETQG